MRMVPSSPLPGASGAERKVFYALKTSGFSDEMVCLHSLGLPNHAYKKCCELDFVLLGPEGIFALEVKGGGITRTANGTWIISNRRGEGFHHREGPFRQVQGNLFALLNRLKHHIPATEINTVPTGWGVVFPDCIFDVQSSEWDNATVADQRHMNHFPVWLDNLIRYYRKKSGFDAGQRIRPALLQRLMNTLRPEFEKALSLAATLDTIELTLTSLTEDQCRAVDILVANPRVLCSGGAGTGKTFLAMELARRAVSEEKRVHLCCPSPGLKAFLASRLTHPCFEVLSTDKIRRSPRKPEPADLLVIDEGQDLINFADLDILDKLVAGGLEHGNWCIFFDSNNQTGLLGKWEPEALTYLGSLGATHVPLTRNCRNTRPIVEEVEKRTGCDMGRKDEGEGPQVEILTTGPGRSAETLTATVIEKLSNNGVPPGHITLLSPFTWAESCASRLPEHLHRNLLQLDDFNLRAFPPQKTTFSQVKDFKGLENTAIILLDLDQRHLDRASPSLLYVGMSRARAYLALIVNA